MKIRDFSVDNYSSYDIRAVIKKVLIGHYRDWVTANPIIHPILDEKNLHFSFDVSFDFRVDEKPPQTMEQRIRNQYTERIAEDILVALRQKYDAQVLSTQKDFEAIKTKCDFVFKDSKEYLSICKELEFLYFCEASTILKDYYNKIMGSTSAKNLAYRARDRAFKNNTSPTEIGCV